MTGTNVAQDFVIVGAGGHAKVVAATILAAGHRLVSAYDDDSTRWGQTLLGAPIVGPISALRTHDAVKAVIGMGSNASRERLATDLAINWGTVVHPRACVHESVRIGLGTVVFAGAVIQPDTVIGAHVIVNTSASIDHDCVLGDFVHVAPGVHLAGGVLIGDHAFLGVGSAVIPCMTVGRETTVGAGSVVVRPLPDRVVAWGCPATVRRPSG